MATRGSVRGDGPRFARTVAPFGGQSARSDANHTGLPHPAIHPGQSGSRGGYDGAKRKKGTKVHAAVDTLGHLLALHVTAANEQEREHVGKLAETVQEATDESVELAYVEQGYTGERPATEAETHGMRLEVVKHEEAKWGFSCSWRAAGWWSGISHGHRDFDG
jgi:transposase